jgi:HD-GYP domain-containing protein (c-di-GMP phosphodiesterase class II)
MPFPASHTSRHAHAERTPSSEKIGAPGKLTAAELNEHHERAQAAIIAVLAECVEQQDPYTRDHGEQVSQYARLAAERLALTDEEKHVACCAALLHDVPAQPPLQALIQPMPFDFASG